MILVNSFLILIGKSIIFLSKTLNLGSGSTWPGHIALKINPNFNKEILKNTKAKKVVIAGTNGKTTTGSIINTVLSSNNKTVVHNQAGANLLNGLASSLIQSSSFSADINKDYIIFESDEFALPQILENIQPDYLICLNLFRDQLDRYGELDSVAKKWKKGLKNLSINTKLILNADDPLVSYLGEDKKNTQYFGLKDKENLKRIKHGADSLYCPNCSSKLTFDTVYFSHLGNWHCTSCKLKRPKLTISNFQYIPLPGLYNKYNTLAASLFLLSEGLNDEQIVNGLKDFKPVFGRQEKIRYKNHDIVIFLSKNPTSFNESLSTVKDLGEKNLMFIINDRIPDGLDVSWIWDIGFERIIDKSYNICVSGDRCYDIGIRLKYAEVFFHIEQDLKTAIDRTVQGLEKDEKLYILPNYSAMLDVRQILLGRKLL